MKRRSAHFGIGTVNEKDVGGQQFWVLVLLAKNRCENGAHNPFSNRQGGRTEEVILAKGAFNEGRVGDLVLRQVGGQIQSLAIQGPFDGVSGAHGSCHDHGIILTERLAILPVESVAISLRLSGRRRDYSSHRSRQANSLDALAVGVDGL